MSASERLTRAAALARSIHTARTKEPRGTGTKIPIEEGDWELIENALRALASDNALSFTVAQADCILKCRDALIAREYDEVWHQLYMLQTKQSNYDPFAPWINLEILVQNADNAAGRDHQPVESEFPPSQAPVPAAPMPIDTAPGTAVRYAYPKNGGGYEGKRAEALGIRVGDVLTVDCTDIHRSSTTLYLREFPGEPFNTVNFALAIPEPGLIVQNVTMGGTAGRAAAGGD